MAKIPCCLQAVCAAAIMFNVLFLGVIYVMINLIVDIIYAYVDPRVRLS